VLTAKSANLFTSGPVKCSAPCQNTMAITIIAAQEKTR
jgi:hypothetical protein